MNQELIDLLKNLVKINSIYPQEKEISDYLFKYLKSNGFKVQKQKVDLNRFNLLASKGSGKKFILFYGHLDTVPVVERENWETDPHKPVIKSNKLFGLGASDMKGGLSAFLTATKETNLPIKILLAADEENISEGAWKAVKENKTFFKDVELVISSEPSFGLGLNGITTGRTGRCIYEIVFKGKPAHIIKYKEGVDAFKKLTDFGSKLYKVRETLFKSKDTVIQIRKISGESQGMSVCGEARAEVEVILGAEDNVKSVLAKLKLLSKAEVSIKPRKTPYLEGYYFKEFPYQKEFENIIKEYTKKTMQLHRRKSVGDDNVLASLGIPVVTWGPEGGNEHKPNEYVDIKSLDILSKMYKSLLERIEKANEK